MKQVFILGASAVYGVGAGRQGWGDQVKSYVHSKMYGEDGTGEETHEVFNFAKSGITVEFVEDTHGWLLQNYKREGAQTLALVSLGGNDSKAENEPGNYVCTPEAFKVKMEKVLQSLQTDFDDVIFVSNNFVDESKTTPKTSPFGKSRVSYFTNERRTLFNSITKEICQENKMDYVAVDTTVEEWVANYVSSDGLHPNQAGYDKVFENIKPVLDKYL